MLLTTEHKPQAAYSWGTNIAMSADYQLQMGYSWLEDLLISSIIIDHRSLFDYWWSLNYFLMAECILDMALIVIGVSGDMIDRSIGGLWADHRLIWSSIKQYVLSVGYSYTDSYSLIIPNIVASIVG